MADILIKNMEMPSKCFDCGFCYDGDRIRYCLATPWQKEIRKEVFAKRREDFCPLVALPEHGDLIERDKLLKFDNISYVDTGYWMTDYEAVKISVIKKAPVIVEANNGNDN